MAERPTPDDALDRLLAQAQWPEPAAEQIERLRSEWQRARQTQQRRRRLFIIATVAAAASVLWLVVVGGQRAIEAPALPAVEIAQQEHQESDPPAPAKPDRPKREAVQTHSVAMVREPTLYERAIIGASRPARTKRAAETARARRSVGKAQVVSGDKSEEITHLVQQGSVAEISNQLVQEPDPHLRRSLLAELLARGTEESVGAYLTFAAQASSRDEALAALTEVGDPPYPVLFAYLEAPQATLRRAAAETLAMSENVDVIRALALSLENAGSRQSALLALLLNRSPQAAAVLDQARHDLSLMASVRAAELSLQQLTRTN